MKRQVSRARAGLGRDPLRVFQGLGRAGLDGEHKKAVLAKVTGQDELVIRGHRCTVQVRPGLPILYRTGRAADGASRALEDPGGGCRQAPLVQSKGGKAAPTVIGRKQQPRGTVQRHEAGIAAVGRLRGKRLQRGGMVVQRERGDRGTGHSPFVARIKDGQVRMQGEIGGLRCRNGQLRRADRPGISVPARTVDALTLTCAEQDPVHRGVFCFGGVLRFRKRLRGAERTRGGQSL